MYTKTIFIVTTAIPNLLFLVFMLCWRPETTHPGSGDYQADLQIPRSGDCQSLYNFSDILSDNHITPPGPAPACSFHIQHETLLFCVPKLFNLVLLQYHNCLHKITFILASLYLDTTNTWDDTRSAWDLCSDMGLVPRSFATNAAGVVDIRCLCRCNFSC